MVPGFRREDSKFAALGQLNSDFFTFSFAGMTKTPEQPKATEAAISVASVADRMSATLSGGGAFDVSSSPAQRADQLHEARGGSLMVFALLGGFPPILLRCRQTSAGKPSPETGCAPAAESAHSAPSRRNFEGCQ